MGLKFDGVDLKEQFGFVVTKADGRGSPPISSTKLVVPRVDGAVLLNQRMDVRRISISGYVYGSTAAEAAQKKDGLIKLISTAYNSEKKLQFPDTNRYIYVRLAGEPIVIGPVGPVFGAYAYEISLNFEAIDPYFYGDEFNYNNAGFVFSVDADAPIYLISPRREFLDHEPNVTIYPVTIVNLLGKYGDFETDSNGDGLADRWSIWNFGNYSITTGIIGAKALYFHAKADGTNGTIYTHFSAKAGHTFFITVYERLFTDLETTPPFGRIYVLLPTWGHHISLKAQFDNTWHKLYSKAINSTEDDGGGIEITMYVGVENSNTYGAIDGFAIYDLTSLGALPPPLQELYGVENWADLDEDTLAQLLPFVNGVATLGFMWAGDL